jgi:nitrogen fixation protein FixH
MGDTIVESTQTVTRKVVEIPAVVSNEVVERVETVRSDVHTGVAGNSTAVVGTTRTVVTRAPEPSVPSARVTTVIVSPTPEPPKRPVAVVTVQRGT